jgi:hypothetical protein
MNLFEIKSLLTKFFYKNDHLCFQILIQGEFTLEVYGEYIDYNEYKAAFDSLQNNFINITPLKTVQQQDYKTKVGRPVYAKMA